MSKVKVFLSKAVGNLKATAARFPIVLVLLVFVAVMFSLFIEDAIPSGDRLLQRLAFAGIFGVFFGACGQFLSETLAVQPGKAMTVQWSLRIGTLVAAALYFMLLTSDSVRAASMTVRLLVLCFALFALMLYFPAAKGKSGFNEVALIHFKGAFVALLYSVVLFLGLIAIYYAIDLLLVNLDSEIPAHLASAVFIVFAPLYYLALLPKFGSADAQESAREESAAAYPRFLEILVSYIAIPLIALFTAVLAAYFIKIVVTLKWPVGQIGPMVLAYSATGLILYILCGKLENRFAILYRKALPIALLPLVALQMVSVGIRINAYGITESRYYVALFGVYAIACAAYLLLSRAKKPALIALLAACFAVFSILPPVDAFTVSRASQAERVERILVKNNMLANGVLTPREDIPADDRREITNITDYLSRMGYLDALTFLPEEIRKSGELNRHFVEVFGFTPYYSPYSVPDAPVIINAGLDYSAPLDIAGYDALLRVNLYSDAVTQEPSSAFTLGGKQLKVVQKAGQGSVVLSVVDESGASLIDIPTKELIGRIARKGDGMTYLTLPLSDLTLDVQNDAMRVRIVIESISVEQSTTGELSALKGSAYFMAALR